MERRDEIFRANPLMATALRRWLAVQMDPPISSQLEAWLANCWITKDMVNSTSTFHTSLWRKVVEERFRKILLYCINTENYFAGNIRDYDQRPDIIVGITPSPYTGVTFKFLIVEIAKKGQEHKDKERLFTFMREALNDGLSILGGLEESILVENLKVFI